MVLTGVIKIFVSSLDTSLTSHSLLAALDTVGESNLNDVLQMPDNKMKGMKSRDDQIKYYLSTHPYASWNHLAGTLLYKKQHRALEKVKGNVRPDKGRCVTLV